MRKWIVCIVFALALCASARATLAGPFTSFTPGSTTAPGTGLVDQYGFTDNEAVSGQPSSIVNLVLTLTLSDSAGLDLSGSGSSTMTGVLTLRNGGTTLGFISLTDITGTGSPGDWTYTADLSTTFAGLNPNETWSLALTFPSGNDSENTLINWSLDITAVPEPATWGAVSGLALLAICGVQLFRRQED